MAELAGLLLAVPPVIDLWLKHYMRLLEVYKRYNRFADEYHRAVTQVELVRRRLDFLKEKLLIPMVNDDEELEKLKFNERTLDAALRNRLSPSIRQLWIIVSQQLSSSLDSLEDNLSQDGERVQELISAGTSGRLQATQHMWFRIKFSLGKEKRDALIADVTLRLTALDDFLIANDEIVALKTIFEARRQQLKLGTLFTFWEHAKKLRSLLTWTCTCPQHHCADLQLVHEREPELNVELILMFSEEGISWTNAWNWTRACVSSAAKPAQVSSAQAYKLQPPTLIAINNMCETLGSFKFGSISGLLQSENSVYKVELEGIYDKYHIQPKYMVSLRSLLNGRQMKRPQRHRLAVIIASSHLQLHHSGFFLLGILTTSCSGSLQASQTSEFHSCDTGSNLARPRTKNSNH